MDRNHKMAPCGTLGTHTSNVVTAAECRRVTGPQPAVEHSTTRQPSYRDQRPYRQVTRRMRITPWGRERRSVFARGGTIVDRDEARGIAGPSKSSNEADTHVAEVVALLRQAAAALDQTWHEAAFGVARHDFTTSWVWARPATACTGRSSP
jgi:hypothetical protein